MRVKTVLVREEVDANKLLQQDWNSIDEHEIVQFNLSVGKMTLNLEIKLARLEDANGKLADSYKAEGETESTRQFHAALDEDSEFIDNTYNWEGITVKVI